MTRTIALRIAPFVAAIAFGAAPVAAQEDSGQGWIVTVGGGAQLYPTYPGADSYSVYPMATFGLRREGRPMPFSAADDGAGFGLLGPSGTTINFGPALRFQSKREADDVGAPVGDVGFTVEVGGFVELYPTENLRLRGELRQGLGGHDGLTGDVGVDFVLRDEDSYIFSIGPRARWADDDYHDAYFGVPLAIPAAGLAAYNPGGGFHSVGAIAGYRQRLGRSGGLFGYAGYDRLIGDAADSPIVRVTGSRDQFSGGLGLFFEFTVGGR